MQDTTRINDQLTVGPQPDESGLKELSQQGFQTVINLRVSHEEGEVFAPEVEADKVKECGMQYLHLPVSMKQMRPEQVDDFRHALNNLPGPVYVHCAKGKRAGAFAMMVLGRRKHWSGDETLRNAEQYGFACDSPQLATFVRDYVQAGST